MKLFAMTRGVHQFTAPTSVSPAWDPISTDRSPRLNRMIKLSLPTFLLFGALSVAPHMAIAARICFPDGGCFTGEGTCEDFIAGDGAVCTETAMVNPQTDFLLYTGGSAWLVKGGQKTPVASDSLASFLKGMKTKYPKQTRKDPKILKQINAEYAAFHRTPDDHKVSPERLKLIAQQLRLSIFDRWPNH